MTFDSGHGPKCIDGDGAHAVHEHIIVDDIPRRGALLAGLIASL